MKLDIPDAIIYSVNESQINPSDRVIAIKLSSVWPSLGKKTVDVLTISNRVNAASIDFWCKARSGALADLTQSPLRLSGPYSVFPSFPPNASDIYVARNGPLFLSAPLVLVVEQRDFFNVRGKNLGKYVTFLRALTNYVTIESRFVEATLGFDQIDEFIKILDQNIKRWAGSHHVGADCSRN